jgi:hypothetical protein
MKKAQIFDMEMGKCVLNKCDEILAKPRVNAYTPQSLVEIIYAILSISFNQQDFEKRMFLEYSSGSKPWWLSEDLDYPTATKRLQALTDTLRDELVY